MSTPKKTPAPKKLTTAQDAKYAALLEEFSDFPNIDVLERRLDDPEVPGSTPIRLKDEPDTATDPHGRKRRWHLRWVNGTQPNRYHQVTQGMGYVPVRWDELRSIDDVSDKHEGTPQVRRGDKGQEVLCKMPLPLWTEIRKRRQSLIDKRSGGKAMKEDLQQAAALQFGAEAGDAIGGFIGDVKVGARERVSLEE